MSERLCVKACNKYLNLNYACFMCHDILYVVHVHFMQICIFECLKCNDECFLVNMLSIEKTEDSGFINWMFRFIGFAWQNWMVWFVKQDCPILTDLAYVSPILFVVILFF
jgi:hypothetical protein